MPAERGHGVGAELKNFFNYSCIALEILLN
jgi:hypothetical protein